jgi:hypothetical protein
MRIALTIDSFIEGQGGVGRAPLAPISLVQELADFNPHVIHNHSMGTMGIQALAAAHLLGVPILGTCHIFLAGFLQYAPISLEVVPLTIDMAWRYTTTFFNRFPRLLRHLIPCSVN